MLSAMDDGATSTVTWLVLGAVLGIALVALVTLLAVLAARRRAPRPAPEAERDDLATFLEHPPGSPGAPPAAGSGWAPLAPLPEPDPGPAPRLAGRTLGALAGAAAAVLVLVGVVAALAAAGSPPQEDEPAPEPDGVAARLAFGGVVLERRAVGVTATYPRVEVTTDGDATVATVELPTWNCLTDQAPADPEAAGCTRSVTEVAELSTPELEVTGEDGEVRLTGDFATSLHANGSPPEPTGRTYRITVTASAGDPAEGVIELGDDSAHIEDGDVRLGD
jgi:hypothetical protein